MEKSIWYWKWLRNANVTAQRGDIETDCEDSLLTGQCKQSASLDNFNEWMSKISTISSSWQSDGATEIQRRILICKYYEPFKRL